MKKIEKEMQINFAKNGILNFNIKKTIDSSIDFVYNNNDIFLASLLDILSEWKVL